MNPASRVTVNPHNVVLEVSVETAKAVASVLGAITDRTVGEFTDRLFNDLADMGLADGIFRVFIEDNEDYDPTDEDDVRQFIVLEND